MKTNSIFALAAVAGLASAQFPGLPDCAVPCISAAVGSAGCDITDAGCQCSSTDAIQGFGAGCILGACTGTLLNEAITAGQGLCSAYLATVSATTTSTSTSIVVVATTTTTPSSTTSTTTVTAETTNIAAPNTTAPPFGGNTTILTTGGVTSSSTSGGASGSATASEVPVNGAQGLVAGIGGLVGLVAGFVAAVL